MDGRVDVGVLGGDPPQQLAVGDVALVEDPVAHEGQRPAQQGVQDHRRVTGLLERLGRDRPDVAGAAGDQDLHARHPSGEVSRRSSSPMKAEQLGLYVGVVGHLDLRAVLPAGPQDLVHRLHARQQHRALLGVEGLVLAGRPREVPGVHEDVGGVEPVDRLVERHVTDVRVLQHHRRRRRVVEQGLHGVAVHLPRRRPGRRRPTGPGPAARRRRSRGSRGTTPPGGVRRRVPSSRRPARVRPSRWRPARAR